MAKVIKNGGKKQSYLNRYFSLCGWLWRRENVWLWHVVCCS